MLCSLLFMYNSIERRAVSIYDGNMQLLPSREEDLTKSPSFPPSRAIETGRHDVSIGETDQVTGAADAEDV